MSRFADPGAPQFFFSFFKILFLSNPHTQRGAETHNPRDQELHVALTELARHCREIPRFFPALLCLEGNLATPCLFLRLPFFFLHMYESLLFCPPSCFYIIFVSFPSCSSVLSVKVLIWVTHMIFVFLWLISLSIISSRSIHVVADGKISFFLIAK